ncbi:hypothetical protein RHMOL_Rhmol03G0003600 [Rhododendron molle]|uniref:Uncharacterized protein n=1 Tax=Rhododendron molle TaxID=49168 RepID=A0ACC0PB99_RHOML|nr:hypothetical protein RHMOL_Rhmol03G0003600 [Rhododendron molle]
MKFNNLQKLFVFSPQASFEVDTGIRFLQYAALAWSVVDLLPYLFCLLREVTAWLNCADENGKYANGQYDADAISMPDQKAT